MVAIAGSISHSLISIDPLYADEMLAMSPVRGILASGTQHDPHQQLEIPDGQPIPSVKLIVHPDAVKGWNLEIQVTNFSFAPEHINTKSLTTEGHAHLYIDGKKVTRLYGSWYYLSSLEPGQHKISVTLNANGHQELAHKGQVIGDSVVIQVRDRP